MSTENYNQILALATKDVNVLQEKGRGYGRSWISRGGVGAFMMLARKWDRIENASKDHGYDIFNALANDSSDLLDDIADLRRYLLLVESEHMDRLNSSAVTAEVEYHENSNIPK